MAGRSGLHAQVGFKAETTYGTYVAPDRFLEFLSEGIVPNQEKIRSAAIRRGQYVQSTGRWAENKKGAAGPVAFEVGSKGFGLLFKHAMGAVAITTPGGATNARLHRHTLGDLDDLSFTIQVGIPDTGGTTRPFSFVGAVCTGFELTCNVDGLLLFTPTFDCQAMVTNESLASASFPSDDRVFGYQQVAVEVDGDAKTPTAVSFNLQHAMKTDRYFVQASHLKKRPARNAHSTYGGSLTFEFDSMTEANYFLTRAPGEEVSVQATATGEEIDAATNNSLVDALAAKVVMDGSAPTVEGADVVTVQLPFEIMDDGSAEPFQLDYVTSDTAS